MTVARRSTETRWDEMRPMEYHNRYPTLIEIQSYDLDDYTLK